MAVCADGPDSVPDRRSCWRGECPMAMDAEPICSDRPGRWARLLLHLALGEVGRRLSALSGIVLDQAFSDLAPALSPCPHIEASLVTNASIRFTIGTAWPDGLAGVGGGGSMKRNHTRPSSRSTIEGALGSWLSVIRQSYSEADEFTALATGRDDEGLKWPSKLRNSRDFSRWLRSSAEAGDHFGSSRRPTTEGATDTRAKHRDYRLDLWRVAGQRPEPNLRTSDQMAFPRS